MRRWWWLVLAFILTACGGEPKAEAAPPQVFYDESNETVQVVSDRAEDDLFWLWFLLYFNQPMVVNNYSNYTSYRTEYVTTRPAYVAPVAPKHSNPPQGGGAAPKAAPQQPKSQPQQQPKQQPAPQAPRPPPPAPPPRTK